MAEHVLSRLKDEFGRASLSARGAHDIMANLMFRVLALTVRQLLNSTR